MPINTRAILAAVLANLLTQLPLFVLSLFDNPHTIDPYQHVLEKTYCYFPFWASRCPAGIGLTILLLLLYGLLFGFLSYHFLFRSLLPPEKKKAMKTFFLAYFISAYPLWYTLLLTFFVIDVIVYGFV
ncbi:MAG: hypothetical protein AABX70_07900 [Nanoarchaeota archaeon]|mgnify:CR=1